MHYIQCKMIMDRACAKTNTNITWIMNIEKDSALSRLVVSMRLTDTIIHILNDANLLIDIKWEPYFRFWYYFLHLSTIAKQCRTRTIITSAKVSDLSITFLAKGKRRQFYRPLERAMEDCQQCLRILFSPGIPVPPQKAFAKDEY